MTSFEPNQPKQLIYRGACYTLNSSHYQTAVASTANHSLSSLQMQTGFQRLIYRGHSYFVEARYTLSSSRYQTEIASTANHSPSNIRQQTGFQRLIYRGHSYLVSRYEAI